MQRSILWNYIILYTRIFNGQSPPRCWCKQFGSLISASCFGSHPSIASLLNSILPIYLTSKLTIFVISFSYTAQLKPYNRVMQIFGSYYLISSDAVKFVFPCLLFLPYNLTVFLFPACDYCTLSCSRLSYPSPHEWRLSYSNGGRATKMIIELIERWLSYSNDGGATKTTVELLEQWLSCLDGG